MTTEGNKMSSLSFDLTENTLIDTVKDYAYNGMELCRMINGFDPWDFKLCCWTVKEKPWGTPKNPKCRRKIHGCRFSNSLVYSRMKKLHKNGRVKTQKLVWLDGRDQGIAEHSPTDVFRFWFTDRSLLAARLIHDVLTRIGEPAYL